MDIKTNSIILIFLLCTNTYPAPALTNNQILNQVKKIMPATKKAPTTKKPIPAKPNNTKSNPPTKANQPKKITVITNLNELTKTIEKFHADQKKIRASHRAQPWNQYVNIQEKCPCTGPSCTCSEIPKLLAI
jgi:hypothetical protein